MMQSDTPLLLESWAELWTLLEKMLRAFGCSTEIFLKQQINTIVEKVLEGPRPEYLWDASMPATKLMCEYWRNKVVVRNSTRQRSLLKTLLNSLKCSFIPKEGRADDSKRRCSKGLFILHSHAEQPGSNTTQQQCQPRLTRVPCHSKTPATQLRQRGGNEERLGISYFWEAPQSFLEHIRENIMHAGFSCWSKVCRITVIAVLYGDGWRARATPQFHHQHGRTQK